MAEVAKVVFEPENLGRPEVRQVAQQDRGERTVKQSCCCHDC